MQSSQRMPSFRPVFCVALSLLLVALPLCLANQQSHDIGSATRAAAFARPARRLLGTAAAGESLLTECTPRYLRPQLLPAVASFTDD
jgi:hypothetical protein